MKPSLKPSVPAYVGAIFGALIVVALVLQFLAQRFGIWGSLLGLLAVASAPSAYYWRKSNTALAQALVVYTCPLAWTLFLALTPPFYRSVFGAICGESLFGLIAGMAYATGYFWLLQQVQNNWAITARGPVLLTLALIVFAVFGVETVSSGSIVLWVIWTGGAVYYCIRSFNQEQKEKAAATARPQAQP